MVYSDWLQASIPLEQCINEANEKPRRDQGCTPLITSETNSWRYFLCTKENSSFVKYTHID